MNSLTSLAPGRFQTPGRPTPRFLRPRPWKSAVVSLLGSLLSFASAGESVKVSWKANPERDINAYEIHYGTVSGTYTRTVRVGGGARATKVDSLAPGTRYYFALVAVNTAGLKSVPSEEASFRTAGSGNRPPNGWILDPATGGTIRAGDSVSFSANAADPDGDKISVRWDFGTGSGVSPSTSLRTGAVRFNQPGTFVVKLQVTDQHGLSDPTPASRLIRVLPAELALIPRSGWALRYVNSEESNGFAAARAFDGDPSTFWHTSFRISNSPPPHELQIQLDTARDIGGFRYLPRQDAFSVGDIASYRFYVSMDGANWGPPVASGSFGDGKAEKEVRFPPKKGRFIRFVSLGDGGVSIHSNVAELNLLAAPAANRPPVAKGGSVKTPKNKAVAITLKGSDPDGNPLHYRVLGKPKNGTLQGIAPALTYRPKRGFQGADKIRYRVSDGSAVSKVVTIKIRVTAKKKAKNNNKNKNGGNKKSALAGDGKSTRGELSHQVSVARIDGARYRVLTIRKADLPAGRRPVVQVSSDLVHWSRGPRHTTVLRDDRSILKVRDNTPLAPGRKRHIRLKLLSR